MKLKPYPEYKDSGVEWIGEIPKSWDVKKLKHIVETKITDGPHETPELLDDGIPFISAEAIKNDKIDFSLKRGYISEYVHKIYCNKCKPQRNDIFLIKSGATTGNVALVETNEEFSIWSPLALIRINKGQLSPYLAFYILLSDYFKKMIEISWSYGTQQNIGMGVIENISIVIPDIQDQSKIITFLNKKTSEIDLTIEKDTRLMELLKEKRTAMINHVVTKGLDPTVKMKDSGVEWIGEIPEDWEVKKLKHTSLVSSDKLNKKPKELPYIGLEHIQSGNGVLLENNVEEVDSSVSRFRKGDILFGKLRPYLAKVIEAPFDGVGTTELVVIRMNQSINSHFAFYQLLSDRFINLVNALTYGVKMPRANPDQIVNISICVPPIKEQKEISFFLDKETSKIDNIIQKIQENIFLLEEYKKSLIHHVVTGKVDVREVAV